ncbi:alpha/beta hydrolase [Staphylococcus cornubiensis]|uniref:alpha/beta hydrolase n=1 Tax=Staphylococcus cornubiensis TaxID=1986155 RepID=UPI0013563166|nr:alpha/beta hydrolase [Staphylococcus cornubiensis]
MLRIILKLLVLIIFILLELLLWILGAHIWAYVGILLISIAVFVLWHQRQFHQKRGQLMGVVLLIGIVLILNYGRLQHDVSFRGNLVAGLLKVTTRDLLSDDALSTQHQNTYHIEDWHPPKHYTNQAVDLKEVKGYLLKPQHASSQQIVYQIHGGGYINGFSNVYNRAAVRYSKASQNAPVFSIDYRVAPKYRYPTALNDVEDGYRWLLKQGYDADQIIIAGDSAGGGLALALTLKLQDTHEALPKMLILSSPWTDLAAEGASYRKNFHKDVIFGSDQPIDDANTHISVPYAQKSQLKKPYVSPAYGTYRHMPPMLIQTGEDEMLLSDSQTVAHKVNQAGGEAQLITYHGMFHTFYILTPWLPESRTAWNHIHHFIQKHA